jgi:hypothetical protein
MVRIEGGCHCGAVRFIAELPSPQVRLDDCDCSICRMTGYLHLLVPDAAFHLVKGEGELVTYRFGTGTARHMFCGRCGIKSFYKPRSHPHHVSVNYRCLDESHGLEAVTVPFDGKNHPGVIEA